VRYSNTTQPIVEDGAAAVPADRKVVDDALSPTRTCPGCDEYWSRGTPMRRDGLKHSGWARTQANRREQLPYSACVICSSESAEISWAAVVSQQATLPSRASATVLIADTDLDDWSALLVAVSELFVPLSGSSLAKGCLGPRRRIRL